MFDEPVKLDVNKNDSRDLQIQKAMMKHFQDKMLKIAGKGGSKKLSVTKKSSDMKVEPNNLNETDKNFEDKTENADHSFEPATLPVSPAKALLAGNMVKPNLQQKLKEGLTEIIKRKNTLIKQD